jgi:hypothetical protein
MDATRIRDRKQVMLKKVLPEEGPHELSIIRYFSSNELRDDSRNHCVPLLELIDTVDTKLDKKLMVMPFLRPFNHPHFQTFGEFVAFFMQICEVRLGKPFRYNHGVLTNFCSGSPIYASAKRCASVSVVYILRRGPFLKPLLTVTVL